MPDTNWKDQLSTDQLAAATHVGSHARLLAGPGTGKTITLTRRVLSLVIDSKVPPEKILAITFTRMAAFQLRSEIKNILEPMGIQQPRVSTLHSFALRQLMKNSKLLANLPTPLLIADDWEERNIIEEDLKFELGFKDVRDVKELLNKLSAGFETLDHERVEGGILEFPDPHFLGIWSTHRRVYGYTLRSELVYQLKQALDKYPEFILEADFKHLLIDEFQDLNACDLAIVRKLSEKGIETFVAGDDDQSIYGFRYADPSGIRTFVENYPRAVGLALEICYRCDRNILQIAEFVANQDAQRLPKPTRSRDEAGDGIVEFHGFRDQNQEGAEVAEICAHLIADGHPPQSILILMRNDLRGSISGPIVEALRVRNLPIAEQLDQTPLDSNEGRLLLTHLRLCSNLNDSLAWRTLLQIQKNGIGGKTILAINKMAADANYRFAEMLFRIAEKPELISGKGKVIAQILTKTQTMIGELEKSDLDLSGLIKALAENLIEEPSIRAAIVEYLDQILSAINEPTIASLIQTINTALALGEQELALDAVNIMTMHRAKGLNADNVIIVGAEDQFIPGRNEGQKEGDERRLLYVSMTRARNRLYITFCRNRVAEQVYTGRDSGNPRRTITRFLEHSPYKINNH